MKPTGRRGDRKHLWAIGGVGLFAALDIVLIGAAYVHGHPQVQGTPSPISTYSSPAKPANSATSPPASPVTKSTPTPSGWGSQQ